MRDAIGSTWIFSLVISFTLIFTGFLVLALSYSKAYKIKNEMTSIIEKYEGLTNNDILNGKGSIQIINQYLQNSGYRTKGNCEVGSYAADDLSLNSLVEVTSTNNKQKYYYCISKSTISKNTISKNTISKNTNNCTTIFKITVFYDFNLPVLGQLVKYSISGQTNEIYGAYFLNQQINCLEDTSN